MLALPHRPHRSLVRSFKQGLLQLHKAFVQITLTRDRGSGEVRLDAQGQPQMHYPFDDHDRQSLMDGMEKCMRIASAAGAHQLSTGQVQFGSETEGRFNLPPMGTPEREAAMEVAIKQMREIGFPKFMAPLFSAHQMGTCRMGTDMRSSVVKETGENWEVRGLYVADASTFPTASGANPMITTMAIAHRIAQGLKEELPLEKANHDRVVVPTDSLNGSDQAGLCSCSSGGCCSCSAGLNTMWKKSMASE